MDGRDRDWQRDHNTLTADQYYFGRQMFLLASLIQFTLPGCPCIYYGDEAGLVGYADPFNRGTYPWGREDAGLVEYFRILGNLRKENDVLRRGRFEPLHFDDSFCVFQRVLDHEAVLVAVNRTGEYREIPWDRRVPRDAETLLTVGGVEGTRGLHPRSGIMLRVRQ